MQTYFLLRFDLMNSLKFETELTFRLLKKYLLDLVKEKNRKARSYPIQLRDELFAKKNFAILKFTFTIPQHFQGGRTKSQKSVIKICSKT